MSLFRASVVVAALYLLLASGTSTFLLAATRAPAAGLRLGDVEAPTPNQLAELAKLTTLSIDTGDLDVIEQYAATGLIEDATTNPLFVSQAGLSGDSRYIAFVDEAVAYAKEQQSAGASDAQSDDGLISLAMDRLSVNLGRKIVDLVPGYVSTEVDIRESFDTEASVERARRLIAMYEDLGVPRSRILVKLTATWEGIKAAEILEKEGITCNLTLVFGFAQAVAAAQAGATLISPFPGRVLDWHKQNGGGPAYDPEDDPGVVDVKRMYAYYKKYGHDTICMPASWRASRGEGYETDEIVALAGVDRMTIPPPLLEKLALCGEPLPRILESGAAAAECADGVMGKDGRLSEKEFRMLMTEDLCASAKLSEGIIAFVRETEKLIDALRDKLL